MPTESQLCFSFRLNNRDRLRWGWWTISLLLPTPQVPPSYSFSRQDRESSLQPALEHLSCSARPGLGRAAGPDPVAGKQAFLIAFPPQLPFWPGLSFNHWYVEIMQFVMVTSESSYKEIVHLSGSTIRGGDRGEKESRGIYPTVPLTYWKHVLLTAPVAAQAGLCCVVSTIAASMSMVIFFLAIKITFYKNKKE